MPPQERTGTRAESDATEWNSYPGNTMLAYTSSAMIGTLALSATAIMSSRCWREKTDPLGLEGLVTKMAAVWLSISAAICSRSTSHPRSGLNEKQRKKREKKKKKKENKVKLGD